MTVRLLLYVAIMVLVLPALGLALAGGPVWARIADFPPRSYVPHADFSWPAFVVIGSPAFLTVAVVMRWLLTVPPPVVRRTGRRPLPWWGWLGLAWIGAVWWLNVNRYDWFAPLQAWTFTPLWLGYIVVVNALTRARTGACLLLDRTAPFLLLFPFGAAFWWLYEYLNRFIQNWYYAGIAGFSGFDYVWFASLPFSTVLAAVLSTYDWLRTFPRLAQAFEHRAALRARRPRRLAVMVLIASGVTLFGVGIAPDFCFGLVWVAPFTALFALQALRGQSTVMSGIAHGDWRVPMLAALAGLVCGVFWEMWNWGSLASWRYSVPFVHRFEIFAMPALGYAGYLPFGIGSVAVAQLLVTRGHARRPDFPGSDP